MAKVLLDYQWDHIAAVAGKDADPETAFRAFQELVHEHRLEIVPFIPSIEIAAFFEAVQSEAAGADLYVNYARFLQECEAFPLPACEAVPVGGPPDLKPFWKNCLYDVLRNGDDWRSPQLLVPMCRRDLWPNQDLIGIKLLPCDTIPESGPHTRPLATVELYSAHLHVNADFDPWDVRIMHPIGGGQSAHECRLPKPPSCEVRDIQRLPNEIRRARQDGFRLGGNYFYIPPATWTPTAAEIDWRAARAFPTAFAEARNKNGFLHHDGSIWVWDVRERHWDVQFGGRNYVRVSHTGRVL